MQEKLGGPITRRLQGCVRPGWKPAEKKCPTGDGQDQAQVKAGQTTVRLPTFKKNPRPQAQQRQEPKNRPEREQTGLVTTPLLTEKGGDSSLGGGRASRRQGGPRLHPSERGRQAHSELPAGPLPVVRLGTCPTEGAQGSRLLPGTLWEQSSAN